ncbi:hypothetical protein TNIN_413681 [Trichonephila inaurata madagascariensis]|uniref:Uncharacterized protein n=1 Tax=Trichonephila inaurata madagascariensis TaxID=2747483 RepID=A0A8X6XPG3_9ARAC|nr:hypothetical protein TNIN_413681 [Trichonephila inaurata madagascariensis]
MTVDILSISFATSIKRNYSVPIPLRIANHYKRMAMLSVPSITMTVFSLYYIAVDLLEERGIAMCQPQDLIMVNVGHRQNNESKHFIGIAKYRKINNCFAVISMMMYFNRRKI